ncbi:hypothetical protein PSH66_04305 [Pseudomonas sp. FP597]|nr:hypothetical protein [Pseudomonas sp. FP597]WLI09790.1 hypothetical protein PSH66_04305 [Pseudomonas sp. FP597]
MFSGDPFRVFALGAFVCRFRYLVLPALLFQVALFIAALEVC